MQNPILNQMQQNNQAQISQQTIAQAKQIMGNMNNPLIQMAKTFIGNKNPKDVFYNLCNQKGINPDDILNQINGNK